MVALAVMAFVPSAMAATANGVLEPSLALDGVTAQGGHVWFGDGTNPVDGYYTPRYNDVLQTSWSGIVVEPVYGGGVINVLSINWIIDGDNPGHAFSLVHPGGLPGAGQYVNFGSAYHPSEGMHTIESWLTETTATAKVLVRKPIVTDTFGIDNTSPEWQHVTIDEDCYYNIPVKFSAIAADPYGSGVAPTPTATWDETSADGVPLTWDKWIYEVTGTVAAPGHPFYGTETVMFYAEDMVGNYTYEYFDVNFDLVAPSTTYTIDPAGADNQNGWTNKPVTVKFKATDMGGAGVDYTEYIVKTSATTAPPTTPGIDESGTKGTSVVINTTAPIGPNYVYYRSVDDACPTGNKEAWKLVMVFFDNVAPAMSDNTPDWWINNSLLDGFTMWGEIAITASDHNSGLAAPGIKWELVGHPLIFGSGAGPTIYVPILALGIADGIRDFTYTATDKAGNVATGGNSVKIDTRGPVTEALVPSVGSEKWINGLVPYVLLATDQVPGAGVAATVYRVNQATPWSINEAGTVAPTLETALTLSGTQGSLHTIDFASVDAALPFYYGSEDGAPWLSPSWHYGNWELDILNLLKTGSVYKSLSVKLDITAPVAMLASPVNPDWQQGPATLNFTGTDVGSGYAYTEWSTDGGVTVNKGEVAQIGGNGVITVNYRGVDKVGIRSAWQPTTVSVATTGPKNAAKNATVVKGKKATIKFKVTAVTPKASVNILIRKNGQTKMLKRYSSVTTNQWVSRSFTVNLPKGKYLIRVDSTDLAGNVQTVRGQAYLTVK
jgi:hypothetical protein